MPVLLADAQLAAWLWWKERRWWGVRVVVGVEGVREVGMGEVHTVLGAATTPYLAWLGV